MNRSLVRSLALACLVLSWWPATVRAGDGVVALQSAQPSCADDSGDVYVDCGNGTVTDNRTGLVWLQDGDCFGDVDWHTALWLVAGLADIPDSSIAEVSDCGLSDGSLPGEWRLPSASELERMIADADGDPDEHDCVVGITNDDGSACWTHGCHDQGYCSFHSVENDVWSSTTILVTPPGGTFVSLAWYANGNNGLLTFLKTNARSVWPVRGGR